MHGITRRSFLKKTLSCTLAAGAFSATSENLVLGQEEKVKTTVSDSKAPFKVLYNNDTSNTFSCVSPWHKRGERFSGELLAASIDEVAGMGVDVHLLSPGLGWIPWWPSEVYPDHYQWWMERTGLKSDHYGYSDYMLNGGDMVKVLVDCCKANGMAPFVSYRLNDCHALEYLGTKHPKSAFIARFYEEHPEYLLDPDHQKKKPEGYSHYRAQNWAIPEVRNYKFALIEELCTNYDLAGLELDYLRDDHMFRQDETNEQRRVEIITGFVGRVRKMMDRTSRNGRRRYLCVRIPAGVEAHGATGLDVRELARVGVDMFNLSGWYHTNQRTDTAEVREAAPNASIYLEMTHSTGSHHFFVPGPKPGNPRTSDEQFYTSAHLAYERGADGISLFNFVYYRGDGATLPPTEPPFHVLPRLSDPEWLAQQPQYYWLSLWSYNNQIPKTIGPKKPVKFVFDLAPPKQPKVEDTRLRVHTEKPLGAAELSVKMNGTALEPTDGVSAYYGNPDDVVISKTPQRRAWTCPVGILRDGLNELEVAAATTDSIKVIWVDLAIA